MMKTSSVLLFLAVAASGSVEEPAVGGGQQPLGRARTIGRVPGQ